MGDEPSAPLKRLKRSSPHRLSPRPITMAGLPDGWSARLSGAGTVVFVHGSTGHEQAVVPSGFAKTNDPLSSTVATVSTMDVTNESNASVRSMLDAQPRMVHHPLVLCDVCEQKITGNRYQCISLSNFDLCEPCMWNESNAPLRRNNTWMKMSFIDGAVF